MAEGWGAKRPTENVAHYYKNQRSLCGKVSIYTAPLDADHDDEVQEDDCPRCRHRLAQIGTPTPPTEKPPVKRAAKVGKRG